MPESSPSPQPPVSIALVGACGLIGTEHLRRIVELPQTRLAAVVDPSPAAADLARAHGVPHCDTLESLLASGIRADAVLLATPSGMHEAQAHACLDAGVPFLLEKPVTDDLAGAERLLARQGPDSPAVLVGHHRTHSALIARAREVVRSGALGDLVMITGTALFPKPAHYFETAPWRRGPGGGPILTNLIHEIHNLRLLGGEITAVQAHTTSGVRGWAKEDSAVMLFEFASGAIGTFALSDAAASGRSWEQTSGENTAYPHHEDADCYHLTGTRGSLAVPTMRLDRFADDDEPSWWTPMAHSRIELRDDRERDPLTAQLAHFAAVVRGECAPACSLEDGVRNLRVVDAVLTAAATGARVTIDDRPTPGHQEETWTYSSSTART